MPFLASVSRTWSLLARAARTRAGADSDRVAGRRHPKISAGPDCLGRSDDEERATTINRVLRYGGFYLLERLEWFHHWSVA